MNPFYEHHHDSIIELRLMQRQPSATEEPLPNGVPSGPGSDPSRERSRAVGTLISGPRGVYTVTDGWRRIE